MHRSVIATLAIALLLFSVPALAQIRPPLAPQAGSEIDAQSALDHAAGGLTFIENRGQWDAEARYLVRVGGLDAWVTDWGLVFDFYEHVERQTEEADALPMDLHGDRNASLSSDRRGHVVRMQFEGAAAAEVSGWRLLEGCHNYFLGNDPARWATNIPLYGEVMVSELYDGVGMRIYDDGGLIRYDLLTAPGADLSQVRLRLDGPEAVWVTPEGDLAMETSLGEIRQAELLAYQEIGGRQVAVAAAFHVLDDGVVAFVVEPLDASLPLVIDPLIYSTFLGGASDDRAFALAVDASGNAFVAGHTESPNFPTTVGAYQTTDPGSRSAFVTKLTPSGGSLVYSTFLGGEDDDYAYAIAVDASGDAFIAGETWSPNFPTTEGVFQAIHPGILSAFVTKLNATGAGLVYSTFLGGGINDRAFAIAVDDSGSAFVVGETGSSDFPTTEGVHQSTHPGILSAFVTKLNPTGSSLVYSTFLGGSVLENAFSTAVNSSGNAFVAGRTWSQDFPTTEGAYQTTHPGGSFSAYVTKLDASGSGLVYSTFLGGDDDDMAWALAVDGFGNVFVVGSTGSSNFPTTDAAFQTTYPGGEFSGFVTKLNPSGASLIYSTFLGGSGADSSFGAAVNASGNAYVAGLSYSPDFPTTESAYQTTPPGGLPSGYMTKLDASGASLVYSTFLGGQDDDLASAMAVGVSGDVFVVGLTESSNFPTTDGVHQTTYPGGSVSAFVTKFDPSGAVSLQPGGSFSADVVVKSTYPNPFAQSTRVRFAVSEPAVVNLAAFDLLGRRVATIADEPFDAGIHERVFDASGLSTGVYVVRMTSGEFSQSRRVVVLR